MGKLGVPPPPKTWVFALAAAPLALLIAGAFGVAGQSLGPNPIRELTHVTGKTALNLVMITLMVSPARALTGDPRWVRIRRMLGLWTFAYAALHLIIYIVLELDLDLRDLGRELVKRPFIWVGATALLGGSGGDGRLTSRAVPRSTEQPTRHMAPAAGEFTIERPPAGTDGFHGLPVRARMVHVAGVRQLVQQQVIEHGRRLERGADIETDHAASGTRPPAGALATKVHRRIGKAMLLRQFPEPRAHRFPAMGS